METYEIVYMEMLNKGNMDVLDFFKAELIVVEELGTRNWYVDVSGIRDRPLLDRYSYSDDIRVELKLRTADGDELTGDGYFHPKLAALGAAIRGDGRLNGYDTGEQA
ncbi:hypothetical protein SY83_07890 [Paenibacillus swuensis]|uniref:Uncharacterized protein n=1 Tax=Paenibacillus swuensis TaxID=1178515 RepID=A0A172TH44_9BACL|nr:hypothetical protein [Paenibacillus swuensis]ANE46204.1 hypothetical protein SY83_07890 [Paenibacillus swuensis]